MAIWNTGFAPVASTYSLSTLALDYSGGWPDLDRAWWSGTPDNWGITFMPRACGGVHSADYECNPCDAFCGGADPDDPYCITPLPEAIRFEPFWLYGRRQCSPVGRDPNALYQSIAAELPVYGWQEIARRLHLHMQGQATDITGAGPSDPAEAIGALLRARGTARLGGGILVVPGYAIPRLMQQGLITVQGSGFVGPAGMPVLSDPGLPVTGPGGAAPAAGNAFIYIMDQAPAVALRPATDTGYIPGFNYRNVEHRRAFTGGNDECFTPLIRQMAIFAYEPCGLFAIETKIKDCCCS